jgi:hypothetical protein
MHTTAIDCSPFGQPDRTLWTAGILRHLIKILNGDPVVITLDAYTGTTVFGATLLGVEHDDYRGGDMLQLTYDGLLHDHVPARISDLGTSIIPMVERGFGAKSTRSQVIQSYRAEQDAAISIVKPMVVAAWPAKRVTRWSATPYIDHVAVVGKLVREDCNGFTGQEWHQAVPLDRLPAPSRG